jgi:hypothetical protein
VLCEMSGSQRCFAPSGERELGCDRPMRVSHDDVRFRFVTAQATVLRRERRRSRLKANTWETRANEAVAQREHHDVSI